MSCEYRGSVVSCELLCQLCLFAIGCVLVDNALRGRLVNGLDSREVCRFKFIRPMEYPAEAAEKPAATIAHPAALLALLMAFTNSGVTTC